MLVGAGQGKISFNCGKDLGLYSTTILESTLEDNVTLDLSKGKCCTMCSRKTVRKVQFHNFLLEI